MSIPNTAMDTTAKRRWYGIGLLLILFQILPLLGSAQCAEFSKWGDTPDSLVKRAIAMKREGKYLEAIARLNCALKDQQDSLPKGDVFFSENYYRLGYYYSLVGYNQEAVIAFQACLSHLEKRDSLDLQAHQKYADVLNAMGDEYSKLAQFDKAKVFCLQAVDSTVKYYGETNPDAVDVLATTSEVLRLSDPGAAMGVAKRAMAAARGMKPVRPNSFVGAAGALSSIFLDQGQVDSASFYLKRALPYLDKASAGFRSEVLQNMGDCLILEGKVNEGIAHYEDAIYIGDTNVHRSIRDQGRLYVRFAEVLKRAKQYDQALGYLQCALNNFVPQFSETSVTQNPSEDDWNMEPQLFEVFRHKAGCFAGNGQIDRAFESYDLAFRYLDYLRKGFNTSGARTLIARFAFPFYEEAIALALDKFHTTHDRTFLDHAFQYMEQSKTNEILESLQEMEQSRRSVVDPQGVNDYRYVRNEIARLNDDPIKNAARLTPLFGKIDSLYKKLFPLTEEMRKANLETPSNLQKGLDSDELFLEYFLGDSTLFVFAIDSSHYDCYQVPITKDFNTSVEQLMESLRISTNHAKTDWGEFAPYASYLYAQLIGPVIVGDFTHRPPKSLTIIPDGRLALLPFECLLTTTKESKQPFVDADYLGRFCAVRYGQSASTLKAQHHIPTERNLGGVLAMAATPKGLPPIDAAVDEARKASDVIDESDFLSGNDATSENLFDNAQNYRILHLACHANVDTNRAMHSWFALQGKNGSIDTLFAHEISNDTLNSDLVVLSACGTGMGKLQTGEGIMSLARSFQMAGCRTTVMSLWNLNDKSTKQLMTPFYERLALGNSASESMLFARKAYFSSRTVGNDIKLAHPHYWAAMVTVGEDGPHLPQFEVNWLPWLIWGSVIAALIAFWQRRRRRRRRKSAFA